MPDFSRYKPATEGTDFDFNILPDGAELEFEVRGFKEAGTDEKPVIIQKCVMTRIVSLPDGYNPDDFEELVIDKPFDTFHRMGASNQISCRILRNIFKDAGFDTKSWTPDSDTPVYQMLPMSLRLLAVRKVRMFGKVSEGKPQTPKGNETPKAPAKFFNWTAVSRNDADGVPYPGGLGETTSNQEVLDAWDMEIEGQEKPKAMF